MRPLLTRLRDVDIYAEDFEEVMAEAADRIEELEAALREVDEELIEAILLADEGLAAERIRVVRESVIKALTPAS